MSDMLINIKSSKCIIQLFRYGLVGIVSNMFGYVIYLLLTFSGGTPKLTMSLIYAASAAIGYWGNYKLTFAYKGSLFNSGVRYVIAHSFGYLINLVTLIMMVDVLGYPHQWVQAIAILVVAGFLFLTFKFFVFKDEDFISEVGK